MCRVCTADARKRPVRAAVRVAVEARMLHKALSFPCHERSRGDASIQGYGSADFSRQRWRQRRDYHLWQWQRPRQRQRQQPCQRQRQRQQPRQRHRRTQGAPQAGQPLPKLMRGYEPMVLVPRSMVPRLPPELLLRRDAATLRRFHMFEQVTSADDVRSLTHAQLRESLVNALLSESQLARTMLPRTRRVEARAQKTAKRKRLSVHTRLPASRFDTSAPHMPISCLGNASTLPSQINWDDVSLQSDSVDKLPIKSARAQGVAAAGTVVRRRRERRVRSLSLSLDQPCGRFSCAPTLHVVLDFVFDHPGTTSSLTTA